MANVNGKPNPPDIRLPEGKFEKNRKEQVKDMVTSQEIMEKRFNKGKLFGYHPEEVDSFLDSTAKTLQDLESQNHTLENRIQELNERIQQYQEDEESLRSALVGAQKLGDSMVREARQKADNILQAANEQAEQILYAARRREENQLEGLEQIKQEVSDFKSRLIDVYRKHIELIRELPAAEPEEAVIPQSPEEQHPTEASPVLDEAITEEDTSNEIESETAVIPQPASEGEPHAVSPGGFQISFERFEEDFKGERKESTSDAAQRIASRFDKSSDPYAGMKKDSSKFGQLKFGSGYEVTRDEHKKKR